MKTDRLIDMLSTNTERVDPRRLKHSLGLAVLVSVAVAFCIALLALGFRPDLSDTGAVVFLCLKLAFTIGVVFLASLSLTKLSRPGGERAVRSLVALLPFLGIVLLAAMSLVLTPSSHWENMILGDTWLECLLSIPTIAVVPFAVITWAVRQAAAPTDLVLTGAFAGLVAGGVSAMGYALHCTEDSVPFVAVWYGGTIALCTVAGAMLGPRLLRW